MATSLYRSLSGNRATGTPLPFPFTKLVKWVTLRQGQTSLVAAGPGVAKTALALNLIARANVATLHLSPDSDEYTVGPRLVSITRQRSLSNVLRAFDARNEEHAEYMEGLKALKHVRFSFGSSPSFGDIQDELWRYEQVTGYYPQLIILDNVRNVYNAEGVDGNESMRFKATVDFFNEIAKRTGAHCMLLHHLMGQYEDGNSAPPLSALLGKVAKEPNIVINLFRQDESTVGAVIAKNRDGRSWPDASYWESLDFQPEKQIIH